MKNSPPPQNKPARKLRIPKRNELILSTVILNDKHPFVNIQEKSCDLFIHLLKKDLLNTS